MPDKEWKHVRDECTMTKRCVSCILPAAFPNAALDDHSKCSYCIGHRRTPVLGREKLAEVFQTEKGRKYDCVVPISGGKDSTYILCYAVEVLGLRVIAVNYDSGFQSTIARENMKQTCMSLRVPLFVLKADYENQLRILREVLCISKFLGTFFGICGNCEANIRIAGLRVAKRYRVPFLLYGGSTAEGIGSHSFIGLGGFLRKIAGIGPSRVLRLSLHIVKYCFYSIRQRIEMKIPFRYRFLPGQILPQRYEVRFPKKGPQLINFFEFIEYDMANEVAAIEKTGWRSPPNRPHRFDCLLHCFVNHHWLQGSGISQDGYNYSTLIRDGKMCRDEALFLEERIAETVEKECFETATAIGLKDYEGPKIRAR